MFLVLLKGYFNLPSKESEELLFDNGDNLSLLSLLLSLLLLMINKNDDKLQLAKYFNTGTSRD